MSEVPSSGASRWAGDVALVDPAPARWPIRATSLFFLALVAFSIVGTVSEYAQADAIVWLPGRRDITATSSATVESVAVRPGQRVTAGQLLIEMYNAEERAARDRFEREWQLQLSKMLSDLTDKAGRDALLTLRAERDRNQARMEQRVVRAPGDGVVAAVWVRSGQPVHPGDRLFSFEAEESDPIVVLALPGFSKSHIRAGTSGRFAPEGFDYNYQDLVVETVSDDTVSPAAVKRFLGAEYGEDLSVRGSVLLAEGRFLSPTFAVDGITYRRHSGMRGKALLRLRTQPIVLALLPFLRRLVQS
jgi:hypothetical protein